MTTTPQHHQRKLRQLKYLLRRLSSRQQTALASAQRQTLIQRFKQLYALRRLLPLSQKVKQLAFTVALSLGLHQAQAQVNFAAPVSNPYNIAASGFRNYSADLVDLDGDGDLDLMYGTYGSAGGYSYGAQLLYLQNTGTATAPNFAAPSSNPFGIVLNNNGAASAAPQFADLDADGDMDMMVTYYDYYGYIGGIEYFQNTGTATAPNFATATLNPFGITNPNYNFPNVNLHDIDGDGDFDLLAGEMYGYSGAGIHYQPNTGTATLPAFGTAQTNPFLPSNSFPAGAEQTYLDMADLDGDGDLDLFVTYYDYYGTYQHQVGYFENIGTATTPNFSTFTNNIYNIALPTGASMRDLVFGDLDGDGDEDLLMLKTFGGFDYYQNLTPTGPASVLNFDSSNIVVNEAVGTIDVGVNITNTSPNPVSVDVNLLMSSTADNGLDFVITPTTLTFPANSSAVQSFSVPITDDAVVEGTEQFFLALSNPTNLAVLGANDTLEVTIVDNDFGAPIINFDTSAYSINEGGGSIVVPITITNPSSNATTVEVSIGNSSTAGTMDVNFNSPATLTFGANTSTPLSITIPITDDALVEGTENLVLRLGNVSNGGSVGMTDSTMIEIVDNDSLVHVQQWPDVGRVAVYPNPFSNQLTVEVERPEGKRVRLLNALGQAVLDHRLYVNNLPLSVTTLPAGVYWIQIYNTETGASLWEQRLIHQ